MVKLATSNGQKVPTSPIGDVEMSNAKEVVVFQPSFFVRLSVWFLIALTLYPKLTLIGAVYNVSFEEDRTQFWYIWYIYLTFLSFIWLFTSAPAKDEYLPMTVFAKIGTVCICLFEICVSVFMMCNGLPTVLYTTICQNVVYTLILAFALSHYRIVSYNPYKNNSKYAKNRMVSRNDCHDVQIVQSRSFEITLENKGKMVWCADGCHMKRTMTMNKAVIVVWFNLPSGIILQPGQSVKLIPITETESDPHGVGIIGYRCFGMDVGERVVTTLHQKNGDVAELDEIFVHMDQWDNQRGFSRVVETLYTKDGPVPVDIM